MKKTILFYGLALALLTAMLKTLEYRYFIRNLSLDIYMGALAAVFTGLGIWIGLKVTRRPMDARQAATVPAAPEPQPLPEINPANSSETFGISNRELEVLTLLARGHSNQEIADQLFVSLHTVKTHTSNLYSKLDVKRRTQAVQKAKELNIIT